MKIVILGAGPTGLGAAYKLNKLGYEDWELWEGSDTAGGLARSITDEEGFTWDIGGHVQFSHYKTFDDVMEEVLGAHGWLHHERESWVRIYDTWVPYPFQYNIHRLPKEEQLECLSGLLALGGGNGHHPYANFEDLILKVFGQGLARIFMLPYNFKVWAYPPSEMATGWIGERVAIPAIKKIVEGIILNKDNVSWGPNNTFQFPRYGGTGAIWRTLASRLPLEKMHYNAMVQSIDPEKRMVRFSNGEETHYDALISTIPVDTLCQLAGLDDVAGHADKLLSSTSHIIGVGLKGHPSEELEKKCWMYFPEQNCPFYRVTVFSNYSPNNVPDINRYWSLMAEVSQSPYKRVEVDKVVEDTIQGMINAGLIESRNEVNHTWSIAIEKGYPTPSLQRDKVLNQVLPVLEQKSIYSRGRFGAWKYEVSNQDHSFMQGVEVAQRLLFNSPELTLWFPNLVNTLHPVYGKDWL